MGPDASATTENGRQAIITLLAVSSCVQEAKDRKIIKGSTKSSFYEQFEDCFVILLIFFWCSFTCVHVTSQN